MIPSEYFLFFEVPITRLAAIDQKFGGLGDIWHFSGNSAIRVRNEQSVRLSVLQLGQLVDSTVVSIKPYGAFVDIGGLVVLLHITNISQVSVNDSNEVFTLRSWVRGIIVWMDKSKARVSILTSALEPEPGDMFKDPLAVYAKAEEMTDRYCHNVLEKLQPSIED